MKRPMSLQESTDLSYTVRPIMPGTDSDITPEGNKQEGLVHLLENYTLAALLDLIDDLTNSQEFSEGDPTTEDSDYAYEDRRLLKAMTVTGKDAVTFLTKGRLPDDRSRRSDVAELVMGVDEPKLHLALLKLGNFVFAPKADQSLQAFLDAANLASTTIFKDVCLQLQFVLYFDVNAVIDNVVSLIELDRGFNAIRIIDNGSSTRDPEERLKKKLFDALSQTMKPKVSIIGGVFPVPDSYLRHLVHFMKACTTVHTFELGRLVQKAWTSDAKDVYQMLLQCLKQQTQLEVLHIAATTAWEHELIGKFVESNHTITSLSIDMVDPFFPPSLIEGLKNNRSLETLHLSVLNSVLPASTTKEHSLFPLLTIFKNNHCSARELILDLHRWNADDIGAYVNVEEDSEEGQTFIESLLTNNTTLNSLTLIFPEESRIDLLPLGRGIKHNRALEKLEVEFRRVRGVDCGHQPDILPDTILAFLDNVAKNITLSNLFVTGISGTDSKAAETLKTISARNACFQKYACSSSYLLGAISGFLVTKDIPVDVAPTVQKYLGDKRLLAATRALACVNSASNDWAQAVRRNESAAQLKLVLETPPADHNAAVKNMVHLLGMILTRKPDFAGDVIPRIKESVFLADALVHWLSKDASTFRILAERLNEAGGKQISRKQVISDYVGGHKKFPNIHKRLLLLEKKFAPDQSHLASFMNKQVDYDEIDLRELQAFVGYDFVDPVSDFSAVLAWCIKNAEAELYVAYMANYPDCWLSTMGFLPKFRQRFLSSLALSRQVRLLQIVDYGVQGDAAVVESLLSDGSLEWLTLSNAGCMGADFNLIVNKLAANTKLRQLEIGFHPMSNMFPLTEQIREMFQANQVLERLILRVPVVHPEYALLERLANAESRFQLHASSVDFENHPGDG